MKASAESRDPIATRVVRAVSGTPAEVYSPSDDTFLMLDVLADTPVAGKAVLDVGTGSGALALYCALRGAIVTASDIEEMALEHASKSGEALHVNLRVRLSDLFSNVSGRFDLVIFNPPYLGSTRSEDLSVDGGKRGEEVAERFLGELENHLSEDGTCLLLLSGVSDLATLAEHHADFVFEIVATRRLFFEELNVLRVRFRHSPARQ